MRLYLDLETYSDISISKGTYKYAENAEILLFAYAIDDGAPTVKEAGAVPSDVFLGEIQELLDSADEIVAHNAMFDRVVLKFAGAETILEKWRCTMIQAFACALPGSLDKLCRLLGVPPELAKLEDGTSLVRLFCSPRPVSCKIRRATKVTHPEEWERFRLYAAFDITAMRECYKRMPRINYPDGSELEYWFLDQKINDLGFQVDVELIKAAISAVNSKRAELKDITFRKTEGVLDSTSRRDAMLDYLKTVYAMDLKDLTKATVEQVLLDAALPPEVRELLILRQQASSTSSSKYAALLEMINRDNRARGTIQHLGAKRTGRASGRKFQPQNLPGKGLLIAPAIDFGVDALKMGVAEEFFPSMTHLLASCVRGCLVAAPDKKLIIADLANIESRVAAWIAGEDWKLKAFKRFDEGTGADLYKLSYATSFRVPVESVTKQQRAIGKVCELMLQYQGRVGAFVTGALSYGFDLEKLARDNWETIPQEVLQESLSYYEFCVRDERPLYGLSREAFAVADVLTQLWRNAHPSITSCWKDLEKTANMAISGKGTEVPYKRVSFQLIKSILWLKLPSGRRLAYPQPKIDYSQHGRISFMGEAPPDRKWQRLSIYGGQFLENISQAVSRDVLYGAMHKAWEQGFKTVLHVHDELVTEAPKSASFSVERLCKIMSSGFNWTTGLPLAASGFETNRYRK